jgi:hypothetical protein
MDRVKLIEFQINQARKVILNMNRKVTLFMILGILFLLTACGDKYIQGSGEIIEEVREVSGFNKIKLTGMGRVILTQGEEESLAIWADENLLQYVTTKVSANTLQIRFENNVNLIPTETIILRIGFKNLGSINSSGAVSIESGLLNAERLEILAKGTGMVNISSLVATELVVDIRGEGDIVIAGYVESQEIELNGLGNYNSPNLQSVETKIVVSGDGSAVVWAVDTLDVEINGVGDVSYFGSPTLIEDLGFGGDLNHLGDK